jgi:hypothetical protein
MRPVSPILALLVHLLAAPLACAADIDFTRDVRPILSRHCFKCHGFDDKARKAKLRLDTRDGAVKKAIVPGRPDDSRLISRILATDDDQIMPPPATKNPLTEAEKDILKRWIAAGAEYRTHWAFVAPKQTPLPAVRRRDWPHNAIDYFILARLESEGLRPSPPADRLTLVRRVYLDLIGLPPTPEEADAALADPSPDWYERLVDRLLASPHYGERWARRWLDLARYADTNGYEKDRPRSIWPYRDWVIGALNADKPFDQFTIEQIAGDLLPHATLEQRVATGFHRNTMLNEEGGIDPLEFRFHAMTDRVNTTATAWLGLTLGCAQCHTHKYDPIPQREYYAVMAFLNNADEPLIDVPTPALTARRAEVEKHIVAIEYDLPNRFPAGDSTRWQTAKLASAASAGGATMKIDGDSVLVSGKLPERDTYTVVLDSDLTDVAALRLEALADPSLPSTGPGRTPHGNFVLTEIQVAAAPRDLSDKPRPVKITRADADAAQNGFPPSSAIDGNPTTGWAIHVAGHWNVNRTLTLTFAKPASYPQGTRWTIMLGQDYGGKHTLGRFRLSLGQKLDENRPIAERRRENLERHFHDWLAAGSARVTHWQVLRPTEAKANVPLLTVRDDASVLASGDMSKRDVYDVSFQGDFKGVTALRLEVLPNENLPKHGPGRVYYEGAPGDFFLSEMTLAADGKPAKFAGASHSFTGGGGADKVIDGNPLTGWSINGGQGRPHAAVFSLARPLGDVKTLSLQMVFERYYAAALGRFRVSVTRDPHPAAAHEMPAEIEALLLVPAAQRTVDQREQLLRYYLSMAPELSAERDAIKKLHDQMPAYPTTLVMAERPPNNPRSTYRHHRGEFLQPEEKVEPDVLSALQPFPADQPRNRLGFARWLVDPWNPLVGRVTMNRQWAAFFGRGIVRTAEDFGFTGEPPTHPELLDWLAVEFVRRGWSLKAMHRLIVTSATYQQSSRVTPELLSRDPENRILARGPRVRLEAELLRDTALAASGLLSCRIGGPSVFPPQPPGVTTEGAYGALAWKPTEGPDRYRRGLYTFSKRTAPFAAFVMFDAPSGEACVARREVSDTPLQALTLLNDTAFMECARALGRSLAAQDGSVEERVTWLFRRCLTRPPTDSEAGALAKFYRTQKLRFGGKELDAAKVAGPGAGDANERAAWTATARAVLNLDEFVMKE